MLKKYIILSMLFFLSICNAIEMYVPKESIPKVVKGESEVIRGGEEDSIINLLQYVNEYLWFILGAITFGVLLYAGYGLMTAQGDDKQMQKTKNILIYAGIGIIAVIFSYSIIKVLANLF